MTGKRERENEWGVVAEEATPEVARPTMYKVILLNDDYTPMEFVIELLEVIFNFNKEKATEIMLLVHNTGQGVCGVFTHEVAETKVAQVNEFARLNEYPLLCTMEPA